MCNLTVKLAIKAYPYSPHAHMQNCSFQQCQPHLDLVHSMRPCVAADARLYRCSTTVCLRSGLFLPGVTQMAYHERKGSESLPLLSTHPQHQAPSCARSLLCIRPDHNRAESQQRQRILQATYRAFHGSKESPGCISSGVYHVWPGMREHCIPHTFIC